MSTNYHSTMYTAHDGNDENIDTFFHTSTPGGWWRVDLDSSYCIQSVNLVNRNEPGRILGYREVSGIKYFQLICQLIGTIKEKLPGS